MIYFVGIVGIALAILAVAGLLGAGIGALFGHWAIGAGVGSGLALAGIAFYVKVLSDFKM